MFPSIFTSFTYPNANDRLNSPSHSSVHGQIASNLGQVQAFIGREGANSIVGTLIYDIRSPDSDGGGHVQAVNKGGTGQTTYTKGNMLIATSSSVLSKFAVSSNAGEVLTADPNQATGVKWAAAAGASRVAVNPASVVISGTNEQVLYSASILGSTLGEINAVRFTGAMSNFGSQNDVIFRLKYGINTVASMTLVNVASASLFAGTVNGFIASGNSSVAQVGYINFDFMPNRINTGATVHGFSQGTSSINSSATQNLVITANYIGGSGGLSSMTTGVFVVEKIV